MRNKIFAIFFSAIFLFMLAGAPAIHFLTKYGILEYNNVGNEIEADKTYDDSTAFGRFFNGIENAKVALKDTYINDLPFFLQITNEFKPLKTSIDQPVINWLQEKGNETAEYVCRHVYGEEVVSPDCLNDGYIKKTCKLCGETQEEKLSALGHRFAEAKKSEPTCESDGYTLMECEACSAVEQRDTVPALGHDYQIADEKKSTCTEQGWAEYICKVCGSGFSIDTPAAHRYEDGVCTLCGHNTQSSPSVPDEPDIPDVPVIPDVPDTPDVPNEPDVPDHQHSYIKTVIPATCTEQGCDEYICTGCQDTYKENTTLPTGHKYSSMVVAATCTEDGYTKQVCESCGAERITDPTSAKGHSYSAVTVAPTYSQQGYDLYTCSLCKDSYKDNYVDVLVSTVPEPETTPDAEGTTYSAALKTTDNIFRHYSITASAPGGPNKTTYARIVKLDREVLYENMLNTVKLVNAMVEKDRNVNWYFSFATNIEATEIGSKILPQESTRYIYEDFLQKIDSSVKVNSVEVNSFADYYNKFYVTDHHWNHKGWEEAYNGIVQMLGENYPDVIPIEIEEEYVFDGVEFYGSLARAHANYDTADKFGYFHRDLPYHTVVIDDAISYGSENTLSANLNIYKKNQFNTASGYNHYTEFFRVCKEVKYPENNTGRKLLLIGDSYSLPLLELVAAHFDQTYIRYEDRSWKNYPDELIYDEFIKEKGITDVIVIEEMSKCIMQGYGSAYPSGFLNIFPDENW